MQNIVLQEIRELEISLRAKVGELKGPDEEENKEQAILMKRVDQLRDSLHQTVERAVEAILEQVNRELDPLSHLRERITGIEQRLEEKRDKWRYREQITMREKIQAMLQLQEIEESISQMKPKQTQPDKLIQVKEEELFQGILNLIRVKEKQEDHPVRENYLLSKHGRFNIQTGIRENIKLGRPIPYQSAVYQINQKLYVCGGETVQNERYEELQDFFSFDYAGRYEELASLLIHRGCISLSGLPSQLIAVGGRRKVATLRNCERYFVGKNQWDQLPPLNVARQLPGSVLLKSMKAFCFCGTLGINLHLNSIETLETQKEGGWKVLPQNNKVPKTYHLAAVAIQDKIVVFGGQDNSSLSTHLSFSEEGDLQGHLKGLPRIPDQMCKVPYTVQNGFIFTLNLQTGCFTHTWRIQAFGGNKWEVI